MTDVALPPAVAAHLAEVRRIIASHEDEIPGLEAQIRHHQAEAQKYRLAEASVLHTVELMRAEAAPSLVITSFGAFGYDPADKITVGEPKKRRDLRQVVREIMRAWQPSIADAETIAKAASAGGRPIRASEIMHALKRMGAEVQENADGLWRLTDSAGKPPDGSDEAAAGGA